MKKHNKVFLMVLCLVLLFSLSFADEIQIKSSMDGVIQKCFIFVPDSYNKGKPSPLLVQLHNWGGDYTNQSKYILGPAKKRGWIAICPDFRGMNNRKEACASDLAIQDIIDAVQYMSEKYTIDRRRIYLCGGSGGGHMALVMAGKHPEIWAAVAAFVPITDLTKWYEEMDLASETGKAAELSSKGFPDSIKKDIRTICGGDPGKNREARKECAKRSPITFIEAARDLNLFIVSGRFDKLVPYHHGEDAYKRLVAVGAKKVKFVLANKAHYIDIEEGCKFLEQFRR